MAVWKKNENGIYAGIGLRWKALAETSEFFRTNGNLYFILLTNTVI